MRHSDSMSLHKLEANCLSVALYDLSITECQFCAQVKIKWQISWKSSEWILTVSCQKIHIDWTDLETAYDEFVHVMFIMNWFSDMIFSYFMSMHEQEKKNLHVLKDFIKRIKRLELKIKIIRSDNKMRRKKTICWLHIKNINFESSASQTQEQNDVAEHSEDVIMKKIWVMQISANLSHDLWKKVVNSAVYLYNQTLKEAQKSQFWNMKMWFCS